MLDEPTSGLDPHQVIAVRDLIRSLAASHTVLLASHVLTEIEKIASRIMILLDGALLTADALKRRRRERALRLARCGPRRPSPFRRSARLPASATLRRRRALAARQVARSRPSTWSRRTAPAVRRGYRPALVGRGIAVFELAEAAPDLERIFLDLTRRAAEAGRMRISRYCCLRRRRALFSSPIAYVVMAVFLVIMGYSFTLTLFLRHVPTLVHVFFQMFVLFLLTVPIITMRLVAEERRLRTLEVLLTVAAFRGRHRAREIPRQHEPHRGHAAAVRHSTRWCWQSGAPDWGPIYSGYIGLLLFGAALVGTGLMLRRSRQPDRSPR